MQCTSGGGEPIQQPCVFVGIVKHCIREQGQKYSAATPTCTPNALSVAPHRPVGVRPDLQVHVIRRLHPDNTLMILLRETVLFIQNTEEMQCEVI